MHAARTRRCESDPRSNRACGFPAHGLPDISSPALRTRRVADGPAQAMETERTEEVTGPARGLTRMSWRPWRFMSMRCRRQFI